MKISICIPSHNPQHLNRAVQSVLSQASGLDVEILVLLNNDARADDRGPKWSHKDGRVIVMEDGTGNKNIGYLKRLVFEMAEQRGGEILVELDHDDELLPGCLEWLATVVSMRPDVPLFMFSPCHEVRQGTAITYGNAYGWEHRTLDGLTFNIPFDITPRSLCEIYYAPNHVRAWTRAAYDKAGKHDPTLECGDDHELMIRAYLAGVEFMCAHRPLYMQHFHGENSQHEKERFERIQKQSAANRDKYLTPLVHEWCRRNRLAMLDLGGAHGCPEGYIPVDVSGEGVLHRNIETLGIPPMFEIEAFAGRSFDGIGVIRAKDFLEHIHPAHVVGLVNQIHRNLAPGGWLLTLTPSTDGRGAFQDPTHVSFWNENSWLYYTSEHQAKYVPSITAKFQAVQLGTFPLGEWEQQRHILHVQANLCALHGQRQPGLIGFPRSTPIDPPLRCLKEAVSTNDGEPMRPSGSTPENTGSSKRPPSEW